MKYTIDGTHIRLDLTRAEVQSLIDLPNSQHDLGDILRVAAAAYDRASSPTGDRFSDTYGTAIERSHP